MTIFKVGDKVTGAEKDLFIFGKTHIISKIEKDTELSKLPIYYLEETGTIFWYETELKLHKKNWKEILK